MTVTLDTYRKSLAPITVNNEQKQADPVAKLDQCSLKDPGLFLRIDNRSRVLKTPMDPFGIVGKDGTSFPRAVTHRYHIVKVLADKGIEVFSVELAAFNILVF